MHCTEIGTRPVNICGKHNYSREERGASGLHKTWPDDHVRDVMIARYRGLPHAPKGYGENGEYPEPLHIVVFIL